MSHPIEHILTEFESIGLEDMEGVKLMDRTDTKFSFNVGMLPQLLQQLKNEYRVLAIQNKRLATYNTLYFDTSDFALYHKHHCGALNRYKVRHRTYTDSQLAFLEVKFKNNKGRTIKNRIKQPGIAETWTDKSNNFILKYTPYKAEQLQPVIWINYKRITLVGKHSAERVTIDVDLEFEFNGRKTGLNHLVIAEVKQAGKKRTAILDVFRTFRIKAESLSKYCLGMASLYPEIKHNNFKEKIIYLTKINHDKSVKFASGF